MIQWLWWTPCLLFGAAGLVQAARVAAAGPAYSEPRVMRQAFVFGGLAIAWFGVLTTVSGYELRHGVPAWASGALLLVIGAALVCAGVLSSDQKLVRDAEQMGRSSIGLIEDRFAESQERRRQGPD